MSAKKDSPTNSPSDQTSPDLPSSLINWHYYTLSMSIPYLVGGLPRHPELVRRWMEAKWPETKETKDPNGLPITKDEAADRAISDLGNQALVSERIEGLWTGFAQPDSADGELCMESRQVKAMFKESANVCRTMIKVGGKVIPLRARLAERVFVTPRWIGLGVTEPSGTAERAIHVMTQQGPRTALKRTDYVENAQIECQLSVLADGIFSEAILRALLSHAALNGFGADRSQGYGTFDWVLIRDA